MLSLLFSCLSEQMENMVAATNKYRFQLDELLLFLSAFPQFRVAIFSPSLRGKILSLFTCFERGCALCAEEILESRSQSIGRRASKSQL